MKHLNAFSYDKWMENILTLGKTPNEVINRGKIEVAEVRVGTKVNLIDLDIGEEHLIKCYYAGNAPVELNRDIQVPGKLENVKIKLPSKCIICLHSCKNHENGTRTIKTKILYTK